MSTMHDFVKEIPFITAVRIFNLISARLDLPISAEVDGGIAYVDVGFTEDDIIPADGDDSAFISFARTNTPIIEVTLENIQLAMSA